MGGHGESTMMMTMAWKRDDGWLEGGAIAWDWDFSFFNDMHAKLAGDLWDRWRPYLDAMSR